MDSGKKGNGFVNFRNACTSWTGKRLIGLLVILAQVLIGGISWISITLIVFLVVGILFIVENNPTGVKRILVIVFLIIN